MDYVKTLALLSTVTTLGSCMPIVSHDYTQVTNNTYVAEGSCSTQVSQMVRTYELKPLPSFEGIDENDHRAIAEELMAHIGELRKDLKTIVDKAQCR